MDGRFYEWIWCNSIVVLLTANNSAPYRSCYSKLSEIEIFMRRQNKSTKENCGKTQAVIFVSKQKQYNGMNRIKFQRFTWYPNGKGCAEADEKKLEARKRRENNDVRLNKVSLSLSFSWLPCCCDNHIDCVFARRNGFAFYVWGVKNHRNIRLCQHTTGISKMNL